MVDRHLLPDDTENPVVGGAPVRPPASRLALDDMLLIPLGPQFLGFSQRGLPTYLLSELLQCVQTCQIFLVSKGRDEGEQV